MAGAGWRVYEVSIGYSGRTYAEGKKIGWRDGVHALTCIVRYSPLGRAARRAKRARPAGGRGPVTAESSDGALADTLDSLDDAVNYAGWIYSMMEPGLGPRVLEIGAGHGTLTELLADGRKVVATDVSSRCVGLLRERFSSRSDVEVLEADVLATPDIGGFDSIVMVNVLEHVADDRAALAHLREALHPGGRLLLFVPAFEALYSDFDRRIGHHRRYRAPQLGAAVTEAGFEVVDARYVNSVGAVAWWVVATKLGRVPTTRWSALTYDKAMVPVLRRLESRWAPPFGQSVLCIARRPD
ncbi:MAG TPA: class I SAM-dependent methyltransferase [Acidimicrobiales bacterium]|nr:class I SAM-dependent methyltransferase [Acidimicrobiales bacterium]